MIELNHKIARLEVLIEQHVLHLRSLNGGAPDALKRHVLDMLHMLRGYKDERARREAQGGSMDVAA